MDDKERQSLLRELSKTRSPGEIVVRTIVFDDDINDFLKGLQKARDRFKKSKLVVGSGIARMRKASEVPTQYELSEQVDYFAGKLSGSYRLRKRDGARWVA